MNNMKQAFLSGLVFLGTALTGFIGFAAYTSLPTQNTGDNITQTIWNNLINTVNSIGAKTDGIYNNGGNIGIGIASPSEKLDIGGGNIKMGYEIVNDSRVPGTGAATYNVYCPAGKYLLSASVRTVGGWIEVAHDNLWNGILVLCDGNQFNAQLQSGVYTTLICANIR
ncbi:MAG: hypothetical protein PHR68_01530 [Candidatus Gracilibacteria bacterium]|nr:hypothetical protein [Candidatus Gracilibacteria bacterium]